MNPDPKAERVSRRIIEMLALLAMAYAAAAVVVRVTAPWSGWVSAIKPAFGMALHNGLLIFILGLALFGLFCCAERRSAQIFVGAASVVGAILGLVALLRPWVELPVEFEQWAALLTSPAGETRVGRMSPHTGAIVVCLALGLGLLLRAPATAQWRRYAAFGLGAVALGGCA
ncbi:MAG: hypothetical protein N3I86_16530, partial [Verrucomicrobiae bacterium]|nr:hypothetical protein [Verrucomicrobiae bacterium]